LLKRGEIRNSKGEIVRQGDFINVADQAKDAPYKDEYCCAVLVNGKFLTKNPKATAGATRALLKAAKWVDLNPLAAAKLSVEGRYISSTVEMNSYAISNLSYVPSVVGAEQAIFSAAGEMRTAGMLNQRTDP